MVDDNKVIFFLLPLFYFYIVIIMLKYIVYKYSHAIVYTISCNVVKCFSNDIYIYIYISHALFVNKSLK